MHQNTDIKILFSDFDGTLFSKSKSISETDIQILQQMGLLGIVRVIATGRSFFSIRKVIPETFPIDYIILSSGAGIMKWQTKQLLQISSISGELTDALCSLLIKSDMPFFVQNPLPENHVGYYYLNRNQNPDFKRRLNLYRNFMEPIEKRRPGQTASQFILIHRNEQEIKNLLKPFTSHLHLIKATSPLDHKTLWLEIFPSRISKASAAQWLMQYLNIRNEKSLAIGNDFNDLDLLHWASKAYVMPDSPKLLLDRFPVLTLNNGSVLSALF